MKKLLLLQDSVQNRKVESNESKKSTDLFTNKTLTYVKIELGRLEYEFQSSSKRNRKKCNLSVNDEWIILEAYNR